MLSVCILDDDNEVNLTDTTCMNILNDYSILCHYTNRDKEKDIFNTNAMLELSQKIKILAMPEEVTILVEDNYFSVTGNKNFYTFVNGVKYTHSPENYRKKTKINKLFT